MALKRLQLDPAWCAWLHENLNRGCAPAQLLEKLLANDFSLPSIQQEMGARFPHHAGLLASALNSMPAIDYQAVSRALLTQADSGFAVLQVLTQKLQLYVLEDFLSAPECDQLMAVASAQLRPSTVTTKDADKLFRTSETSDLGLLKNPFVTQVDEKINAALGIHPAHAEGTQAQRYAVGQEFKRHTDYFQPGTAELKAYGGVRGNRTWTFMVYLNEVASGGGTHFFALNKTIHPKKGMALAWNNLYPDGTVNPDTAHSGLPVLEGFKFIITKWYREQENWGQNLIKLTPNIRPCMPT